MTVAKFVNCYRSNVKLPRDFRITRYLETKDVPLFTNDEGYLLLHFWYFFLKKQSDIIWSFILFIPQIISDLCLRICWTGRWCIQLFVCYYSFINSYSRCFYTHSCTYVCLFHLKCLICKVYQYIICCILFAFSFKREIFQKIKY